MNDASIHAEKEDGVLIPAVMFAHDIRRSDSESGRFKSICLSHSFSLGLSDFAQARARWHMVALSNKGGHTAQSCLISFS